MEGEKDVHSMGLSDAGLIAARVKVEVGMRVAHINRKKMSTQDAEFVASIKL